MNFNSMAVIGRMAAIVSVIFFSISCGSPDSNTNPDGTITTTATRDAETKFYRLMIKDDPSTTIVLGYSFVTDGYQWEPRTRVYFGPEDFGRDYTKYPYSQTPTSENYYAGMNNYFVDIKYLKPDTAYYFVVVADKGVSQRYWFKTAPNHPNARLSVIAGGDSRTNYKPRQRANKLVAKLRPHVVMFGGDFTTSGSDDQWQRWFQDWQLTIAADGRMTPALFTRGNHEGSNTPLEKLFYTNKGVYYGVTFGGNLLRVYTLNSESGITGAQTDWLASDLSQNASVKWKFAQYHRPMRPHTSGKKDNSTSYQSWASLFYTGGMNLVSESDAHTVKATWPIRPAASGEANDEGFVRDDKYGTVYVGEGCWGAPLRTNDDAKSWTRDSGRFNHFNWIFVDKDKVEVRTVKVDNADSVESLVEGNNFNIPANLDIWQASNGSVINLPARQASGTVAKASNQ